MLSAESTESTVWRNGTYTYASTRSKIYVLTWLKTLPINWPAASYFILPLRLLQLSFFMEFPPVICQDFNAYKTHYPVLSHVRHFISPAPLLKSLHWLPVASVFVACISFKAIHLRTPQYLHDLLHWYKPVRKLRSADMNLLAVPSTRTTLADRAFNHAAPLVWNALPLSVTSRNTCS